MPMHVVIMNNIVKESPQILYNFNISGQKSEDISKFDQDQFLEKLKSKGLYERRESFTENLQIMTP